MSIHKRKAARGRSRAATDGENSLSFSVIVKNALLALLITVGIGLLLLLLSTAVLMTGQDPSRYVAIVGAALLYLSAALHGMLTVRLCRGKLALFCGLIAGGIMLTLLLLLGLILPESETAYQRPLIVGLYAALPCASLCGAILVGGSRRKKGRKRR